MPRRPARRARRRRSHRRRVGRRALRRLWPGRRRRRAVWRRVRRAPTFVQLATGLALASAVWALANLGYHVFHKPTELFFPVSGAFYKTPTETWRAYGHLFRRHATQVVGAELLAALAQTEGSGNPVVRTYWRWAWGAHPFELYRPASSAVGMYQITDGTFERSKRYCVHGHAVVEEGPWYDWDTCWLNELYFRVVPSHAIELTSAFLSHSVSRTLAEYGRSNTSRAQRERLAALIHLCGSGFGRRYVRRGLVLEPAERCGSHDARRYVERVESLRRVFAGLAAEDG